MRPPYFKFLLRSVGSLLFFLVLAGPSWIMGQSLEQERELIRASLRQTILVATKYSDDGVHHEAIELLLHRLKSAEVDLGLTDDAVLEAKLSLSLFYTRAEMPKEALDVLWLAYQDSGRGLGRYNYWTALLKAGLMDIYVLYGAFDRARAIADEVFAEITELMEDDVQLYFLMVESYLYFSRNELKKCAFLSKISVGINSYGLHNDPDYLLGTGSRDLLDIFIEAGAKIDLAAVDNILEKKNSRRDTPYNKARSMMVGPEVELYIKYGQVAKALNEAGKQSDLKRKALARKAFWEWLELVDETLGN